MAVTELYFPKLPNAPLNFGICSEKYEQLKAFPNTRSRALCAVGFAQAAQGGEEFFEWLSDSAFEEQLRDGYMRAALGDFVSIEEIALSEFTLGLERGQLKIYDSEELLPIFFKELRNLNFHICSTPSFQHISNVNFVVPGSVAERSPGKFPVRFLEYDRDSFGKLANVGGEKRRRYWKDKNLDEIFDWFDKHQKHVGVHRLFNIAVDQYLSFLLKTVNPET